MFDLTTAKTRLNITGTTQDAALQVALDAALAIAEGYCDRKFMHNSTQVETFTHVSGTSVSLIRYPLDADPTLAGDRANYSFHTDWQNGVIHCDDFVVDHKLKVTYSGGYVTLPADLEFALWGIFDGVWTQMQSAGSVSAGGVDKISLVGVGSISYSGGSGGGSGGSGDPVSGYVQAVLDGYRRMNA